MVWFRNSVLPLKHDSVLKVYKIGDQIYEVIRLTDLTLVENKGVCDFSAERR